MNESINFETEKVSKLFKKLFYPTLLGMLSMSAVTAIDGIFVGHGVGSDGIAAVNICIPIHMVLTGVGLMAGTGSSVIASVCLARRKTAQARATVTQALVFVSLVALFAITVILAFPETVARLLGSSEHLLPMVTGYLLWFAPGLFFQMWIAVGMFALRLDGAPKLGMWCSMVSALVNVVLDWLFIFPFGWGVAGAAAATTVSIVIGAAIVAIYVLFFARTLRLHALRTDAKGIRLFFQSLPEQCKIGSSALLGEATMATLMLSGNIVFMHYLGDDGVGAFGICCYYLPFAFMVGNAIAQSAQPLISYNFGAGRPDRVRIAFRVSLTTAVVCGTLSSAAFILMPKLLVGLFLDTATPAADIAVRGLPYFGTGFIFFVVNLAVIGYFQSLERMLPATVFALCRGLLFLVPCFALLPLAAGTPGIWLALPLSEILTTTAIFLTFAATRHRRARVTA